MSITVEELAIFCKKKGFVYPSSEPYGGYTGFFDYGPLGVELKNNLRTLWWRKFVQNRDDVVGLDGSIISHPKIWVASGHTSCFDDILVEDKITKERFRADHLIEDSLKIAVDGLSADDLWRLIEENKIKSPKGNPLTQPKKFNLMFKTNVGPVEDKDTLSYLRPETAQLIFANFKSVFETSRLKLPFGIAQAGKAFRNEISPRDFLFRSREFEQMEIEYFLRKTDTGCPLLTPEHRKLKFGFLSAKMQEKGGKQAEISINDLLKNKLLGEWHAYWLAESYQWFVQIGVQEKNLRIREHTKKELSHYSSATFDVDYKFSFGWKEIFGIADRGQFDLRQHQEHSGRSLEVFDEETKSKQLPWVIEPSFGLDRAFLTVLNDAYYYDKGRGNVVLKVKPQIAPVKVGVFPLVNKLDDEALNIYLLLKNELTSTYDRSGSIGRRYARADEIGIPYCVTIDFDTLEDKSVTVRDRDTTKQTRIKIVDLVQHVKGLVNR